MEWRAERIVIIILRRREQRQSARLLNTLQWICSKVELSSLIKLYPTIAIKFQCYNPGYKKKKEIPPSDVRPRFITQTDVVQSEFFYFFFVQ